MFKRLLGVTGVSVALLLGVAGCAGVDGKIPMSGEKTTFITSNDDVTLLNMQNSGSLPFNDAPFGVIRSENTLFLAIGGSSSCRPAIEKVTVDASTVVFVELRSLPADTACTADYVLYGYQVTALSVSYHFTVNSVVQLCGDGTCRNVPLFQDFL